VRLLALLFLPLLCGACRLAMTHGPAVYQTCSADPAHWTLRRTPPPDAAELLEDWELGDFHVSDAHYRSYWFDGADGELMHCFGAFRRGRPDDCSSRPVWRNREGKMLATITICG
jgi:hypothetical protein